METLRPARVAASGLGPGGDLYQAALQAIDALRIPARAVWRGARRQATSNAADDFAAVHDRRYAAISTWAPSRAVAVQGFDGAQIDLLLVHLDRASEVDEVEGWLQILAPGGVVVMSGTAGAGDAIAKWLKQQRPFEFLHGDGLAVIAPKGPAPGPVGDLLALDSDLERSSIVRAFYSRLGGALRLADLHRRELAANARLESRLAEKSALIVSLRLDANELRDQASRASAIDQQLSAQMQETTRLRELAEALSNEVASQSQEASRLRELAEVLSKQVAAQAQEATRLRELAELHAKELASQSQEASRLRELAELRAKEVASQAQEASRLGELAELRAKELASQIEETSRLRELAERRAEENDALALAATREASAAAVRLVEAEANAADLHRRLHDLHLQFDAVIHSTSWKSTALMRAMLAQSPALARTLRQVLKLVWWTVTLQLPRRLRLRREFFAARAQAQAQAQASATGDSLPAVSSPAPPPPAPVASPPAPAYANAAELVARLDALQHQAHLTAAILDLERDRIDYALAVQEGVLQEVEHFHAARETSNYQRAFDDVEPLVTICVATVNRADLLMDRCIPSLLNQTYRNIQIIVVGDHTEDDTGYRLAKLRDSRIQFLNLSERGPYPRPGRDRWCVAGTYAANTAINLAEGAFITHLDDDDSAVVDRIETLVAAAREQRADFLWHPFWAETRTGDWIKVGDGRLALGQITTGSVFYHRWLGRFGWDPMAYRLSEPGDWNRFRKFKLLRPKTHFVDRSLVFHFSEGSQGAFVAQAGERFVA